MTEIVRAGAVNAPHVKDDDAERFNVEFRNRVLVEIERLRLTNSWIPFGWDGSTITAQLGDDDEIVWVHSIPGQPDQIVQP